MEVNGMQCKKNFNNNISVVVLTYNSEKTISNTLNSALQVSDDVHVVDSYSTDSTLEILNSLNVKVSQHIFEDYSSQRNWASSTLPLKYDWELHLDADESLSEELIVEINKLKINFPPSINGYFIPRLVHFMNSPIRHGGMFPIWHLRLFRRGNGNCERRKYDQHFCVEGPTVKLNGYMIDDIKMSLSDWTIRHNKWAEAEAKEILAETSVGRITPKFFGSPIQRKRYLRKFYNNLPLFVRPFLLFFYRYFIRVGFLDGLPGLIFFTLQTFWFRFLVDAKIYEFRTADCIQHDKKI